MKKSLIPALILAVAPLAGHADYQVEVQGSFLIDSATGTNDRGHEIDIDFKHLNIEGKYHFKPVRTANTLLAEAAFLGKASYAGLQINRYQLEGGSVETDGNNMGFFGRYVAPGEKDFIFEASLAMGDYDEIGVAGGLYLDNDTEILFGLSDSDLKDTSVFAKGKKRLNNVAGKPLVAQGRVQVDDGDLGIQGEGDYYLDNRTSVGARAGLFLEEDTRLTVIGKGQYFINDQFSIGGELGFYNLLEADTHIKVTATGRF